jgi:ABC-type uncharacterized transport system YnjBCD substrate-binding protein
MPNDIQRQLDQLRADLQALNEEVYRNNFTGSQDFNKYCRFNTQLKVPRYTVTPAICEVGEICEVSGKLRICSAANTWTIVGTQS